MNLAALWVITHLLGWGWPPFLTDGLDDLMPLIVVSLWLTVAANLLWAFRDPDGPKRLMQIVLDAVSFVVIVRTWQVFPFDFSGHAALWEPTARVLLGVAFVGVITDTITQVVSLFRPPAAGHAGSAPPSGRRGRPD